MAALAILDVDPVTGTRFVRFWVDEVPFSAAEESPSQRRERDVLVSETIGRDPERGGPDFGGGVDYHEHEASHRERIPLGGIPNDGRERVPNVERSLPPRTNCPRTPPEDQIPRGCSLHSMEPLRDWFCKGADMTFSRHQRPQPYMYEPCWVESKEPLKSTGGWTNPQRTFLGQFQPLKRNGTHMQKVS